MSLLDKQNAQLVCNIPNHEGLRDVLPAVEFLFKNEEKEEHDDDEDEEEEEELKR